MTTKKIIALGCGIVALAGLLVVVAVVLFILHVGQDPQGMRISVQSPPSVQRGSEFELVVMVINERQRDSLEVASVDIAEEYLKGFTVLSCDPPFTASTRIPIDDTRSYAFKERLAPGATNRFSFKLQARKAGRYSGELDVCEGMRFLTMVVETQVE